jgi:hypothetical protein
MNTTERSGLKKIMLTFRHWPIGLMYDNHATGNSLRSSSPPSTSVVTPMRLILHFAAPPNDKLFLSSTIESCKQAFMNQLKEADFIRWGNTRRMVGLRKVDQDGLWEGIKERKSIRLFTSETVFYSVMQIISMIFGEWPQS